VNDVSDFGSTFIDDVPLRKSVVSEPVTRNDHFVSVDTFYCCRFFYSVVSRPANLENNRIAKRQLSHIPCPPIVLPAGLVSLQSAIEQAKWPSHRSTTVLLCAGVVPSRASHDSSLWHESSLQRSEAMHAFASGANGTLRFARNHRAGIPVQISNSSEDTSAHSRGAARPSFAFGFTLFEYGGRRESRVPVAPVGPVQQKARG
jgi:hypothetical protein